MALGAALPAAPGAIYELKVEEEMIAINDPIIVDTKGEKKKHDDMKMNEDDLFHGDGNIETIKKEKNLIAVNDYEEIDVEEEDRNKNQMLDTHGGANRTSKNENETKETDDDDVPSVEELLDMMNITIDIAASAANNNNTNTEDEMNGITKTNTTNDNDDPAANTSESDEDETNEEITWVPLHKRTMSRKDRRHMRATAPPDNNDNNTICDTETVVEEESIQTAWMRTKQRMSENDDTFNKIAMEQEQIAMEQKQIAMEQEGIRQDTSDLANMIEILEQEIHQRVLDQQYQLEMHRQHQLDLEVTEYYRLERYRQDQLGLEMNRQYHLEIPMGNAWTHDCSIMAASTTELETPLGDAWVHSIITTTTQPSKLESQPQENKPNNMCKEKLPSTPPRSTKPTQISPKTPFEELCMLRQQYQISPPVFNPRQPPTFITELQFVTSLKQTQKDNFKAVHTALQHACMQHQMAARLQHTDRMRSKMRRIQLRPIVQELHGSYALQEPETPEYRRVALTAKRLLKNMQPQPSIHSIKSHYKARLTSLVTSATVPAAIAAVTDKTGPSKLTETEEELLDHLRSHEAVSCCPFTGTWLFGDKIDWTPANALLIHKCKRFRMLQTPKRSHPPRWYRHDNRYQILYYYGDIEDVAESIMDLAQRAIEAKVEPPALKPLRKKPRPTRKQLQQRKEANDRRWEAIMNRKHLEPTPDYSEEFALCQQQWFQFGTKHVVDVRSEPSTANSEENYYFHRGRPPDSTPRVPPPPTPIPSSGF